MKCVCYLSELVLQIKCKKKIKDKNKNRCHMTHKFRQSHFRIQTRSQRRREGCPRRLTKTLQPSSRCSMGSYQSHRVPNGTQDEGWCVYAQDVRQCLSWPSLFLLLEWIQPSIDQICSHVESEQVRSTTLRGNHLNSGQGLKNVLIQTCILELLILKFHERNRRSPRYFGKIRNDLVKVCVGTLVLVTSTKFWMDLEGRGHNGNVEWYPLVYSINFILLQLSFHPLW